MIYIRKIEILQEITSLGDITLDTKQPHSDKFHLHLKQVPDTIQIMPLQLTFSQYQRKILITIAYTLG